MPVRTCDLPTLLAWLERRMPAGPVAVAIAGASFARPELLARALLDRLPNLRISPPEAFHDEAFTGVRVWLEDEHGPSVYAEAARARGEPTGSWSAEPPSAEDNPREAAEEAARERADVVFAALEGFPGVVHLRFFYDYDDSPLWGGAGVADPLEELLPITADLRDRVRAWVKRNQQSPAQELALQPEGRALCTELQEQLGAGYRIEYLG